MNTMQELLDLIRSGKADQLESRLTENPSLVRSLTDQGISPLQYAVYCRNQEAVAILRKAAGKLNPFEAASLGETDTIKEAVKKNPQLIDSYSPDGFTLLGLACFFGHLPVVAFLLEQGADPNLPSKNAFKVAPIHSACAISHFEITDLLIRSGANVNARQASDNTPLHATAHHGNLKLTSLLLANGAEVNARSATGQTPLAMAVGKNADEVRQLLTQYGGTL